MKDRLQSKATNQDGIVAASEDLAYALQHPEQGAETAPLTPYTQSGVLNTPGPTSSGATDLLV